MNNEFEYPHISDDFESSILCEPRAWGGSWTDEKLTAFEKYVEAYLAIMNKQRDQYNWELIYFDGFAGSGSVEDKKQEQDSELFLDLFKDGYFTQEEVNVYKGAAERVVSSSKRGFDFYYFIDSDEEASVKLKQLLSPYTGNNSRFQFRTADANEEMDKLSNVMRKYRHKYASLVLLDPFGMQINWSSIQKFKDTRTDMWILIPTGVIVNRLLDRKGELRHIDKLTSFFGYNEDFIRKYFYRKSVEQGLFGEIEIIQKVSEPIKKISELYIQRLKEIFKFVTEQPLVLYNSRGTPIYHFAFGSNNATALKIAKDIIKKQQI